MSDFYPPLQSGDLLLSAKHLFVDATQARLCWLWPSLTGSLRLLMGGRFLWQPVLGSSKQNLWRERTNNGNIVVYETRAEAEAAPAKLAAANKNPNISFTVTEFEPMTKPRGPSGRIG